MKRVDSRVLTLKQPWADLVMAGVKDVENRTWPVPSALPQWERCEACGARRQDGGWWEPAGAVCNRNAFGRERAHVTQPDGPFPFRLWIHSAGQVTDPLDAPSAWQALKDYLGLRPIATIANAYARRGFLLGYVTLTGCHHADECATPGIGTSTTETGYCSRWAEPDVYHWTLEDPYPFDVPIPLKGRQGLWRLPEGVA